MATLTYTTTIPYDAHFALIGSLTITLRTQYATRHNSFNFGHRRIMVRDNCTAIRALRGATMNIVK